MHARSVCTDMPGDVQRDSIFHQGDESVPFLLLKHRHLELVNTTTVLSLHEMSVLLYWNTLGAVAASVPVARTAYQQAGLLGITSANLARILSTNSRTIAGSAQALQLSLQQFTTGTIEFRASNLSNTPSSIISQPGFNVGYQDCTTLRPLPLNMLSVNATLAPMYYVNMSSSIEAALNNARDNTTR